jgi:DNA-binding winged helix-turn-helix (wHTH) protein
VIHIANSVLLDEYNNIIFYSNGELCITEKEKRLLKLLLSKANSTVRKDEINIGVWPERKGVVTENNLLQLVFRLRKKLAICGLKNCLRTVSREGYQFSSLSINLPEETQAEMTQRCVIRVMKKNKVMLLFFSLFIITLVGMFIFITSEIIRCEGNVVVYLSVQNKYVQLFLCQVCLFF